MGRWMSLRVGHSPSRRSMEACPRCEALLELDHFGPQPRVLCPHRVGFAPRALLAHRIKRTPIALLAPLRDERGVQPLAAQDLSALRLRVGTVELSQHLQLVGSRVHLPSRTHLRIRACTGFNGFNGNDGHLSFSFLALLMVSTPIRRQRPY